MTHQFATSDFDAEVLSLAPAVYWKFDDAGAAGSRTFADSSGNGRTFSGGLTTIPGPRSLSKFRQGGLPETSGAHIPANQTIAATNPSWFHSLSAFSALAVFSTTTGGYIVSNDNTANATSSPTRMFDMYVSTGSGHFGGEIFATSYNATEGSTDYRDGRWHVGLMTFGSGTKDLYIDGASVGSASGLGTLNTGVGSNLVIAGNSNSGIWVGALSRIALFTSALTATDAARIWSAAGLF